MYMTSVFLSAGEERTSKQTRPATQQLPVLESSQLLATLSVNRVKRPAGKTNINRP